MKALKFIPVLLSTALPLCGCDQVRAFLGKPTSADIAAMRDSISASRVKAAVPVPVVPVQDTVAQTPVAEVPATVEAIKRYNVVAGAFSDSLNAEKLKATLIESGHSPIGIRLKNGLFVVCALSTDDASAAGELSDRMLAEGKEVWIYDSRTKKHRD